MPAIRRQQFLLEEREPTELCGPASTHWISEVAGLLQFGAFVETLRPGSRSSLKHWHSAEDELVYVLAGEVTLVEGDTQTLLCPGDAAAFKAGVAVGHYLINSGTIPSQCLIVGTRAPVDTITYPEHNRVCYRDRALPDDIWSDLTGEPAANPYG